MILVTGTKRSGTSLWMQILVEGGVEWVGSPFSAAWEKSIVDANPRGFYESKLRTGIFFATNPDPATGAWLHPHSVRHHAVKVFVPGVVRTDFAYIDRVIATMRPWRTYGPSLQRLYDMEDAWIAAQPDGDVRLERVRRGRSTLPPAVEWFFEYFDLLRDVAIRKYPIHLTTVDRLLRGPDQTLKKVFDWLGRGDPRAAATAIDRSLQRTSPTDERPEGLTSAEIEVLDRLYEAVDSGVPLASSFLEELNTTQAALTRRFRPLRPDRQREDPAADP